MACCFASQLPAARVRPARRGEQRLRRGLCTSRCRAHLAKAHGPPPPSLQGQHACTLARHGEHHQCLVPLHISLFHFLFLVLRTVFVKQCWHCRIQYLCLGAQFELGSVRDLRQNREGIDELQELTKRRTCDCTAALFMPLPVTS
jgi:hypothetical protein